MTKKRSPMQSKNHLKDTAVRDDLVAQIAATTDRARQAERQGQFATYWHDKLERLNGRLAEFNGQLEE